MTDYAIDPLPSGGGAPCSRLSRNRIDTGIIVPGCVLEAWFEFPLGTLLFLTHDIPFEEQLDILLLNGCGEIADQAALFSSLTTGHFRDARADGPDSVTFSFFGDRAWRVRLLPAPKPRLPVPLFEPLGVHRPFGWTRRFIVEQV